MIRKCGWSRAPRQVTDCGNLPDANAATSIPPVRSMPDALRDLRARGGYRGAFPREGRAGVRGEVRLVPQSGKKEGRFRHHDARGDAARRRRWRRTRSGHAGRQPDLLTRDRARWREAGDAEERRTAHARRSARAERMDHRRRAVAEWIDV